MTMGRVALQLARRVHAAGAALWLMLRVRDIEAAGFENADAFAREMRRRHPVEMTAEGDQMSRGVLFTTDPRRAKAFVTLLVAAESLEECKAWFEPCRGTPERVDAPLLRASGFPGYLKQRRGSSSSRARHINCFGFL